jgi:hypothetical protein
MGRIYETRKYVMFARFARMSKAFNRIGRDISVAVKLGGPDPKANSRLRIAMQNAKSVNMPKDRVEAAIKRASQKDTTGYEEIIYEGYAPQLLNVRRITRQALSQTFGIIFLKAADRSVQQAPLCLCLNVKDSFESVLQKYQILMSSNLN